MLTHSFQLVSLSLRRATRLLLAASCCMVFASLTQAQDFIVPGVSGVNWVDTGLDIAPTTILRLSATGQVDVSAGWGRFGPDGTPAPFFSPSLSYPANTSWRYGLAARLTPASAPPWTNYESWSYHDMAPSFGDMREHFTTRGGRLWLTVNDDDPGNNTGSFKVHVEQITFPPDEVFCDFCVLEITREILVGYGQPLPDPKAFQALLALDGQITAVNQSGETTLVSVSQGTVLAKYGDLPNLKVVFEKDTALPAPSLSKERVTQGILFQNKKMSLITVASQLDLYSKVTGKMGKGMSQIPAGIDSSINVISRNGILGTPAVMSGEPLIVKVNNLGSAQKEALILQIDGKEVAKVDSSQKVFEYVDKLTQWPVGRHVIALVAHGPKGPQTVWVTSFLVPPNDTHLRQKEPYIPKTKPDAKQTKPGYDEKPPSNGQFVGCPVKETRTEVTTPLPNPWWNTPQIGKLERVSVQTIGGNRTLVCEYWGYGRTVAIMRAFPEGATSCSAEGNGFRCR